ncbi:MAG: serine/threonine-protein kinase [Planctomycetota bacterium]
MTSPSDPHDVPPQGVPVSIGPYRIKRHLAAGGMGVVYEAEQDSLSRTVAVKVLHASLGSPEALRRFEYESETLARLSHPGIAQVFEAGTFVDGSRTLPYFAMELIEAAQSITEFAAAERLDTRQRIELFLPVLEAVAHGHQRGVIHRDLKPANVLVGANGHVKVIDFGVARASGGQLDGRSLATEHGQMIGTLEYMSPEQIEADPSRIDTRTDVYSLGVVLYELLTGRLPHDVAESSLFEATRRIRELPATRLSAAMPALRGDLETVLAKALEKDKERRYASVDDFRRDLCAFLDGGAIAARRPSVAYQLRVFARRNRATVVGAGAVLFLVIGWLITSSLLYLEASAARTEAQLQARVAGAVNDFLNKDLLEAVSPRNTNNPKITMREVLDAATRRIGDRFREQPLVEAAIRRTIGNTYLYLGEADLAAEHLGQARDLTVGALGRQDRASLAATIDFAGAVLAQGKHDEAERLFVDARASLEERFGAADDEALRAIDGLAALYSRLGRFDEAEPLLRVAFETRRRTVGAGAEQTLLAMNALAIYYVDAQRQNDAEALYRQAVPLARQHLGPEHPVTLSIQSDYAWLHTMAGRLEQAELLGKETLAIRRRVLGDTHPDTLASVNNLAVVYNRSGRPELAEPLYREDLAASERVLGEEHPDTLVTYNNLAAVYLRTERFEEARQLLEKTVRLSKKVMPANFYGTGFALNAFGESLLGLGRAEEAEPILVEARQVLLNTFAEDDPNLTRVDKNLARAYDALQRPADAARYRSGPNKER